MDNPQPAFDAPKKFRIGRIEIGLNLLVQIGVWAFVVGMVNYWSLRHFSRLDWGVNTDLRLSPQTKALLNSLAKPAKAIVFFSGQNPEAERHAVLMLREYEYAARGRLLMEIVDPDANRARAAELSTQYKFGAQDSIVIFDYDGRSKFVNSGDLAEMESRDPIEEMQRRMQGQAPLPPARMLAFKGEEVMTSALLEITEPKQNKVYFVGGHGEIDYKDPRDPTGRELTRLKQSLSRQNLLHAELILAEVDKVPDDAKAVMVMGPKLDYSARDLRLLDEYWDRKGRFLICTGPVRGRMANFNQWLERCGVTPLGDDVITVHVEGFIGKVYRAGLLSGNSPILNGIKGSVIQSEVPIQSLLLNRTMETTAQLRMADLMVAPKGFWGETTPFSEGGGAPTRDPKTDHLPPLTLAVQVEKGASSDAKVKLETARMVVVGSSELLSDRGFDAASAAEGLGVNSVNWLLGRENLISLPPKRTDKKTYSLTPEQVAMIGWLVMAYIPLGIAVFGLYHLCWRHGRNLFRLTVWVAGIFVSLVGIWFIVLQALGGERLKMPPKGIIAALSVAVALWLLAAILHHLEQKKHRANQN